MASLRTMTVLSDDEVERIHAAALAILAEPGVRVPHARMRELFAEAGATVDEAGERVALPPRLVERCLSSCGKRFELRGRDPSCSARFGFGERNYNTIFGEAHWIDLETGRRRFATLGDVALAARFGDALPHITVVGAMSDPHEIAPAWRCVAVAAELLKSTGKPIGFWFHDRASARYVVELLRTVAGGIEELAAHPPAYPFLEPISPLSFSFDSIDLLFETGAVPLPVPVGPMAQAGATAPVTLAGTLAQEHAEILAGICVTQLIRPGTPVCYGGIPHVFDMSTTQMVFAGPEQSLMAVAMAQMGRRFGLPVYVNVGLTDSKTVDAQAGMEVAATLLSGVLAGADIFGHMGIAGVDQASSLPMALLQHEAIAYVERMMGGFRVEPATLAVDVVREALDGGFLGHDHTFERFRDELWFPHLLDRRYYDAWASDGSTMADRCRDGALQLLDQHRPRPIDPVLSAELDRIVDAARRELGAAG